MKFKLTRLLILLATFTVLASVALTFAHPHYSRTEEANAKHHEEGEEYMEQMHEECADMMNDTHHNNHNTQMHNETGEPNSHHGCH